METQENVEKTREYMGIPGNTEKKTVEFLGIQGNTGDIGKTREIQGNTLKCGITHRNTREYKGTQENTGEHRGMQGISNARE